MVKPSSEESPVSPSFQVLEQIGLNALVESANIDDVSDCLRRLPDALSGADALQREAVREAVISKLKRSNLARSPARLVDAVMPASQHGLSNEDEGGQQINFHDAEPWPEPVDGEGLLCELWELVRDHVAMPKEASAACAVWILWTFVYERFFIAPLLEITSPTKRCGKTTLLDVLACSCNRALPCSNISQAALYRAIDKFRPTLLVDESDTFIRKNDELRGVLNSGHKKGAPAVRCTGDDHEPHLFDCFGPKAVAGIGDLPGTLRDRAITIRLRRKTSQDELKPVRLEVLHSRGSELRSKCTRWAFDNEKALDGDPVGIPGSLNDRAKDNWRPLLAVADRVGGMFWGQIAREAAKSLSGTEEEQEAMVLLLADIKQLFTDAGKDRLASADIVHQLEQMEARPWPEWRNELPMTARQMAYELSKFGIKPAVHRFGADTARGYLSSDFQRAWVEYCPDSGAETPESPKNDPLQALQRKSSGALS